MAWKSPDSGFAQVLITCHLCSNQVELYCSTCGINLCGGCVGQHMLSLSLQKHDVVKYSSKYDVIFQPFCNAHPDLKCEIYCEECESPVCSKCVVSMSHNNHHFKELQEKYTILKETIAKDTETLESLIVKEYQNIVGELQGLTADLSNNYSNLRSAVLQRGDELHQLIDSAITKCHSDIDAMENQEISRVEQNLSVFQRLLKTVQNKIKENYKYLQSMDKEMLSYSSMLTEFREVPSRLTLAVPPMFIPATMGMNTDDKFLKYIGKIIPSKIIINDSYTLTQTYSNRELLRKPYVIATIEIPKYVYKNLCRLCCVGKEQAWVNGSSKSLIRCDKQGSIMEVVDTLSGDIPVGLAVTKDEELMYTDRKAKSINIVRNGTTEVLCKPKWFPGTICSTDDGDFLVAMWNGLSGKKKEIKVTRFCKTGVKQDIQYDEKGQPLFKIEGEFTGLAVTENRNGNICVADWNANAVVVVDRRGKPRFKYPGEGEGLFIPRYITTDSQAHILISDIKNQSVHVLDEDGNVVLLIDNCGFSNPYGISVDNEDNLWLLERFGKIKIIKYLK
ncbi:uncharacterized protein LOC133196800 [Saccostrea echinata]|uniref:uncharacterized protein LOC133196800 n=1 Tax=Saccostrea echinata TaxID=191078 RepID=UPI002A800285|nr:uncharacterized protein LOC133196800 [Saccostrea echinata]